MTLDQRIDELEEELRRGMPPSFHPSGDQVRQARLHDNLRRLVDLVRCALS